ncbi:MAG: GIY-YIG nuclease family protein [Alteromonadaceae bacterium]|nr:GIY-YIG nuclease family protein [Alteromonadaceae bacterium]
MDPSTGRSMRGFNPQLKGWFYVQALIQDGQVKAYKFGITNRDPKERMKEHVNGSQYEHIIIAQTEFSIGSNAAALELEVKQKLDTWYLGREELPHGFTETINPCLIDELMAIHNNFQTTQ